MDKTFLPECSGKHEITLAMACMICGEEVPVDRYERMPQICSKCRKAVMSIRAITDAPPIVIDNSGIILCNGHDVSGLIKED